MRAEETGSTKILDTGSSCGEEGVGFIREGGKREFLRSGAWFQSRCRSIRNAGGNGGGEEVVNLVLTVLDL